MVFKGELADLGPRRRRMLTIESGFGDLLQAIAPGLSTSHPKYGFILL